MEQNRVEHQDPGDPLRPREGQRRDLDQGLRQAGADAHRLRRLHVLGLRGLARAAVLGAGLFAHRIDVLGQRGQT